MIITYDDFCKLISEHITSGKGFYLSLLEKVIDNPNRYCGLFRLSNAKTKLIQNVTQSNEIKFGDIIERITTEYIGRLGYVNLSKKFVNDEGDTLNVDQLFCLEDVTYLVEMKIRDDHDSSKKIGQYLNFHKKVETIRKRQPDMKLVAIMWFVDKSLVKNRNYYKGEMNKEHVENTTFYLCYGEEFFHLLNQGDIAWEEFINLLKRYRRDNVSTVEIPDFGSSSEILQALTELDARHWNKLMSDNEEYALLREELFADGNNLEMAKKLRK